MTSRLSTDALRYLIEDCQDEFQLPGCSTLMPLADGFSGKLDSLGFSIFVTLTCQQVFCDLICPSSRMMMMYIHLSFGL